MGKAEENRLQRVDFPHQTVSLAYISLLLVVLGEMLITILECLVVFPILVVIYILHV